MRILAIDPGYEQSAFVEYDSSCPLSQKGHGIVPNEQLRLMLLDARTRFNDAVVIEMVASYGMPVGREVFETCVWIGRFIEALPTTMPVDRIYRKDIKMHLCQSMRATDATIHAALLDRFGPGREKAVGTKKNPGPLYGIRKDLWAALAVAVVWSDLHGGC